jgi:hypothetical protein
VWSEDEIETMTDRSRKESNLLVPGPGIHAFDGSNPVFCIFAW